MTRPLLVLVHGTRFDSRAWDGYAELIPDADVVAVDLPGHGRLAGQDYTSEAAVQVVVDAVREHTAENENRAVVLAGHSLGGYVIAEYACRYPHRLDALVLIGACADPARHPRLSSLYSGFAQLLPRVGAERMAGVANGVMRRMGMNEDAIPDATGYAVTPQAWASVLAEATPEHLRELTCPVFLVAGRFDQLGIDIRHYARVCADPRVRIIERASHLAPMTHVEQVAAIMREAIESCRR
ncbi:alpha/beta fold hydrolase [Gephyromycinifex aptenodytis]|uniref:alpha/beta fold hydrolase n=1 Tax=Gephyromycinifex aptenodytis TaxID=2716227 RepID=UPI001445C710|nr:alpha/beta hydrolase [Gephyromycinifex aptenodytis]